MYRGKMCESLTSTPYKVQLEEKKTFRRRAVTIVRISKITSKGGKHILKYQKVEALKKGKRGRYRKTKKKREVINKPRKVKAKALNGKKALNLDEEIQLGSLKSQLDFNELYLWRQF